MKTHHLILVAILACIFTAGSSAVATTDTHIYAINSAGNMLLFEHMDVASGNPHWGIKGAQIGNGWNFKQLFAGNSGDIYGIKYNGDLYFYKRGSGFNGWSITGKKIGNGWNFKQIFAGDNGAIYAITNNGDMMFYRYAGLNTGNLNWAVSGKKIGTGWNFKQVFAGSGGTIYAVKNNGDLMFYKYAGAANGTINWPITGKKIGTGWNFSQIFAGASYSAFPQTNYSIYGVKSNGDLFFYIYGGASNGSVNWPLPGKQIDSGWSFPQVLATH